MGRNYIEILNTMKKLLFVIPEYSHGGTNKSLENLLHFIDKEKYEISIFSLYEDGGRLYKDIFSPYIVRKSLLYHLAHDNKVTRKIMGALMKLSKNINFNWLYKKEATRLQKKLRFDTVIAFQEGTATEFVSYMDTCKNRIAWIHCDYGARWKDNNKRSESGVYDKFDHIVCVSKASTESMLSIYPQYKCKTVCVYNTIDTDLLKKQANAFDVNFDADCFNVLSVGRFALVKQFHLIPEIVEQIIKQTTTKFCWYIIGDGEKKEQTMSKVKQKGLDAYIKIVGAVDNPYPYFKNADLHVCSSSSESFSYTIAESKILHTPVLCNSFPVAYEVVDDKVGWICNVDEMSSLIADLINDREGKYSKVRETIKKYNYDNGHIIDKFCQLIEM